MRYPKFLVFSVIGAVLWGIGVPFAGYYLGSVIPGIDRYIVPIVLAIILVSVAPGAWHFFRNAYHRSRKTG